MCPSCTPSRKSTSNDDIESASASCDEFRPAVRLQVTASCLTALCDFTGANAGKSLAIVVDGRVLVTAVIPSAMVESNVQLAGVDQETSIASSRRCHRGDTMTGWLIVLLLAQQPGCAAVADAQARADDFDLEDAARRLQAAVMSGCTDAVLPSVYLRGWIAARNAYRVGGSPESLRSVSQSIAMLQDIGKTGQAQIAALVLQAAAAASQSERDDLALMINYATELEDHALAARRPGLPMITAHEAAGDLWLQVHRYEDARQAFTKAAERLGATPRITLGFARLAVRIDALATACRQYQTLVASWTAKGTAADPPELSEARRFLANPACQGAAGAGARTPRP